MDVKSVEEFLTNWSSDTKELLEKQAQLLLNHLKSQSSTYGQLNHLAHHVKNLILYHQNNQVLEPVFEIMLQIIEGEKNALSIKEGE